MNEWGVVTVIIALVGLIFTVGKPIVQLNKTISDLSASLWGVREDISKLSYLHNKDIDANRSAHRELWQKNNEQDEKLNDHEARIQYMERKE